MSNLPTVYITEAHLVALRSVNETMWALFSQDATDRATCEALKDLLNKLEFANDNKLRLSGKMRVIEIKRQSQEDDTE